MWEFLPGAVLIVSLLLWVDTSRSARKTREEVKAEIEQMRDDLTVPHYLRSGRRGESP